MLSISVSSFNKNIWSLVFVRLSIYNVFPLISARGAHLKIGLLGGTLIQGGRLFNKSKNRGKIKVK